MKTVTVGGYQVGKQLGEGGWGKVFLGVNKTATSNPKTVALKVISKDDSETAFKEASLQALCEHQHVLHIHSLWQFNDMEYVMVLDLMKTSLESVKKRFTFESVKNLMRQLLQAVASCHQKRVCHLDIKPSNILLDANNNLKLSDFGLACLLDYDSLVYGVTFTAHYRPPEVILGDWYDGYQADMWAVGLVFAFLILKNQHLLGIHEDNEFLILEQICSVFGMPDENTWPGVSNMPRYHLLHSVSASGPGLQQTFKLRHACPPKAALKLIGQMLTLDPSQRISAEEALQSEYFAD